MDTTTANFFAAAGEINDSVINIQWKPYEADRAILCMFQWRELVNISQFILEPLC